MAVELLASDIVIVEEDPKVTSLPQTATAVCGGVGITEMGPFGPTLSTSFDEYTDYYGGYTASSDLTIAAMGFFLNGGTTFWSARTVHYTDVTTPSSRTSAAATIAITTTGAATQGSETGTNAEPFNMAPGDTIVVKVDAGATQTATFDADAATLSGTAGTYPTTFSGGETLILEIDNGGSQTITFTVGAQTLAQVIDEINPQLVGAYADDDGGELRITSDRKGTGSEVDITGGTGRATLDIAVATDTGGGDVSNIDAVTAAEIDTVVEADTTAQVTVSGGYVTILTPTVGAAGSIQIDATSTADTIVGLDNAVHSGSAAGPGTMATADAKYHGAFANSLTVTIAAASSGDSDEFNLQVKEGSVVLEVFPNLTTVLTGARYFQSFINSAVTGSKYITITDALTGTPPANRPTNGDYALASGSDGLSSLADTDFIGSASGPTGMYELDQVENLTLLIIPNKASAAVHQAMLTYCETWRSGQVFAILDPPSSQTAAQIVTYVKTTAALKQLSEYGAIYWPRIKITNPATTVYTSDSDGNIAVAPSGFLAGVFARTDARRPGGIYDPPAGVERGIIYGCLGFETDETLDKRKRDLVYPELINPLTTWSGAPRHIDGTRTLKSTGNFPTVAERRGVSYIERTIRLGLSFARHANNTRSLRRRCHRTVYLFLLGEMQKGAFRYEDPALAFSVDFSDALNSSNVVLAGQLKGRIGLATNKPVDWAILSIAQDTRAIDALLAELQQGR